MNDLIEILNGWRQVAGSAARPLPPQAPNMSKQEAQDLYKKRVHEATLYLLSKYPGIPQPKYQMRQVVPEYYR